VTTVVSISVLMVWEWCNRGAATGPASHQRSAGARAAVPAPRRQGQRSRTGRPAYYCGGRRAAAAAAPGCCWLADDGDAALVICHRLIGRERGLAFGWASQQAEFSHCWKLPASSPEYGARSIRAGAVRQITRGIAGATATGFRRLQASATAAAGFYSRQILLRAPLAAARLEPASSQTVAIW
jgi:hypothetical protein